MSRPGRFSLRVLGVSAVFFALIVPASFGQVVTLSGETFETVPGLGQQTTYGPFVCNKTGTTVIPFQTQGSAFGPYSGTFTESGTITVWAADGFDLRLARHRRHPRVSGELLDH